MPLFRIASNGKFIYHSYGENRQNIVNDVQLRYKSSDLAEYSAKTFIALWEKLLT